jgi:hypothetical protein
MAFFLYKLRKKKKKKVYKGRFPTLVLFYSFYFLIYFIIIKCLYILLIGYNSFFLLLILKLGVTNIRFTVIWLLWDSLYYRISSSHTNG